MAKRANSGSIGWGVKRQGRGLWSRNAVKGEQVRDERLRRDGKIGMEVVESKILEVRGDNNSNFRRCRDSTS